VSSESDDALLRVRGLSKHFVQGEGLLSSLFGTDVVRAVDDVTFDIERGETLGLVGESGCGKSTLARTIVRLHEPTEGVVVFRGEDLADLSGERLRTQRKDIQMIFQDPQSSLDPRMKVGPIVEEPMKAHAMPDRSKEVSRSLDVAVTGEFDVTTRVYQDADMLLGDDRAGITVERLAHDTDDADERYDAVADVDDGVIAASAEAPLDLTLSVDRNRAVTLEVQAAVGDSAVREARTRYLLESVGLDPQHYNRYPHQFSGGQRQRINLARALSVDPEFIVCDEPTSALDASIQAQVLNTMKQLQAEFGLTYLFISHDLSVIRHISDRVAVMYLGQLVELAETTELFENPQHPYTEALLQSIPVPDPRDTGSRGVLEGDVPSPVNPPSGCRFRTRCPKLIAPARYDLTETAWAQIRRFLRAVDRRTFESEEFDSVRAEFFPDGPPRGEAGEIVETAIEEVEEELWDEASERLDEAFAQESPCAKTLPDYDVAPDHGDGRHFAACHLHAGDDADFG
jgi:oligopeptide/dipeptide ABC transporter ATP-binding protein